MKKLVYTISVLLLAFAVLSTNLSRAEEQEKKPKEGTEVGDIAPDFTLEDINDTSHTLSKYRKDSAVLLVFWYTGCPHCVKEIPDLIKLQKDYGEKGLKILSLNVYDSKEKLKKYAEKNDINYVILDDSKQAILTKYKVVGVPANILIDPNGIIQYRHSRPPSEAVIKLHLPVVKEDEKGKEDRK